MAEEHQQRRLATILAADVVGYSRLMAENEEYALRTLQAYRSATDRLISGHEGRIFNTAGDSILAQFQSAVEAVRCAIAIQQELRVRNAEVDETQRMEFRIGVHVGDVLVDGDNLYGDGVNIAARLEGIARPGEICVSGSVFALVKSKLSYPFEDMGPQSLKNIPEPVSAFRLTRAVAEPAGTARKRFAAAGILAILVLLIAGVAVWKFRARPVEQAWATVQNTTDRTALEDFIRRFGSTSYADLARARLSNLNASKGAANDLAEPAWAAVQNTTDKAALEDFIQRFGSSSRADQARARLSNLNAPPGTANDLAEPAWAAVQNTTDKDALDDFIKRFGNSSHVDQARARLAKLKADPLPPGDPAERAWAAVQNTTDPAPLEDFIRRHGNSSHADQARARLAKLKTDPRLPEDTAEREWAALQNTTDPAPLEDFIRRHGNSSHADQARARLAKLKADPRPPEDPAERAWAAVQNTKDRAALEDFIGRHGNSIYGILARARLAELSGGAGGQDSASVRECDGLAANPDDAARGGGAGIRWDVLDSNRAVPACRSAVAARPDDPRMMYQLGRVLDKQGAFAEALPMYRKAADRGYPEAMNNLGIMFTNGRGVPRDDAEAIRLFRKAADGGSADAITNLGFMNRYGRGVPPNLEEAVRLFRKAADAGSVEGMYWLGLVYETGAGVGKDEAEAFKWYHKAADMGVASAMNKLGFMYANGSGVAKDMTEAIRWYRAAAAAGNADAKATLTSLGN
jgi:class 3 adenylate cyclase/tetratricopeptide (TPR) repeat protein